MTRATDEAVIGLLDAIRNYLGPKSQVDLACAAVCGCGLSRASVAEFTALLGGHPAPVAPPMPAEHAGELVPNHIDNTGTVVAAFHPGDCITCHGHVDASGVFTPAAS